MRKEIYKQLFEVMKKRGGMYAGVDIPEFYEMAEELFTPEEAEINNAMPNGLFTAKDLARQMGRDEADIKDTLEAMSNKGLCWAINKDRGQFYQFARSLQILEFAFMPGKTTEKDKKIAQLIHAYRKAYNEITETTKPTFPTRRVITVDRFIETGNQIHTYDQVQTYIDKYEPIAVASCFCRHEAVLRGEDTHDMPIDVCMQFGPGANYLIERLGARTLTKKEAMEVLNRAEEAGLIHVSMNRQNFSEDIALNSICNCDRWHCGPVSRAIAKASPSLFINSGFEPRFDSDRCTACETCIERCPPEALVMGDEDIPLVNFDRCFGCAVCATGCPSEAIKMVNKPGFPEPPKDRKTLEEAIKVGYK